MSTVSFALIVFLIAIPEGFAACGGNAVGDTRCVLLTPHYSQYQWATCLTDAYIRRVSNGNHRCRDQTASECWYQCQIELNLLESGPVYDNCLCSTANTLPTPADNTPTLPPECYSPGGIDCSWYRDCLETRYPCQGTEDGYAIEYAERYCNLFNDHHSDFSLSGRQWVDGVRKCLQIALVPSLRPWVSKTCADIRNDAFDSHPDCYTSPASGAPSICSLPCLDVWKVFWVVNVIGDAFTSAPYESGKQMLGVVRRCFGTTGCVNTITVTGLSLTIPGLAVFRTTRLFSSAVTSISRYIARSVNFDSNGIGWFPYDDSDDPTDNSDENRKKRAPITMSPNGFTLLLVDLKQLNLSSISPMTGSLSLHEAISALSDAVSDGLLSEISVPIDGEAQTFQVSSLGLCGDMFCSNETTITELATSAPSGALVAIPLFSFATSIVVTFII